MLELAEHRISDLALRKSSELDHGILNVSPEDLDRVVREDPNVLGLDIEVVRPGESVRINGVIDAIEPRAKDGEIETTFPGVATESSTCGTGRTLALRNMTVMTVGSVPPMGETFIQEDCLVDMCDPGARYTPFSSFLNLVMTCRLAPGVTDSEQMGTIRGAGVRVARFLARLGAGHAPDDVVVYGGGAPFTAPVARVAYVCSLISEGPLHDTLLFGFTTSDLEPTWIRVERLIDGAIISSDLHYPNQRTPTFHYQRNPILEAIRAHPKLELIGVILTLRYGSHDEKRAAAESVARLALNAGADALIVHPAVGGNAHIDAIDIVQQSERMGMRSVLVLQEMAGPRGADLGLVHSAPEADALISTGNRDEIVTLPPVERVLGPSTLKNGARVDGVVESSLRSFLCSTSQVGAHKLTTVAR